MKKKIILYSLLVLTAMNITGCSGLLGVKVGSEQVNAMTDDSAYVIGKTKISDSIVTSLQEGCSRTSSSKGTTVECYYMTHAGVASGETVNKGLNLEFDKAGILVDKAFTY